VPELVYVSSASTCQRQTRNPWVATEKNELPVEMRNARYGYPYSKWLGEQIIVEAASSFNQAVTVNPTTVWGAGDRTFNAGVILKMAHKGLLFWWPPGGTCVVSVHDVVDGVLAAWRHGKNGARYLLAGTNVTYKELFATANAVVGHAPPRIELPEVLYEYGRPALRFAERWLDRLGLPSDQVNAQMLEYLYSFGWYSSALAQSVLDWQPRWSVQRMVEDAWHFYQKEGLLA
jgi:dihydroflavonol-4-reductase